MTTTNQQLLNIIENNYNKLESIVNKYFSPERTKKAIYMLEQLQERILMAPASTRVDFHNAYPGGWLQHTLNVINASSKLYNVWKEFKNGVSNFTVEELIFSAMFHDLGKIGDIKEPYYIPAPSWQQQKGIKYEVNHKKLSYWMDVSQRSLFLLQYFDIKVTDNESMAILMSNGLFAKTITEQHYTLLKSNLPIIVHHANFLASRIK